MIFKIITILIDELVQYRQGKVSDEFKRDLQDAINALKNIKKYF